MIINKNRALFSQLLHKVTLLKLSLQVEFMKLQPKDCSNQTHNRIFWTIFLRIIDPLKAEEEVRLGRETFRHQIPFKTK